jgi:iron(III) transport system substrate-binding protein
VLPAAASPTSERPEIQRLLQAARANGETELNLTWGQPAVVGQGGAQGAKQYEAVFNRLYGTNITVNFTPGPSMPDLQAKVAQELAAGHKASTDVLIGNEANFAALLPREVLEPYDYTLLSSRITPEVMVVGDIGVQIYSTIPAILYNSDLVRPADAPKTLEETLDPRWRGKLVSTPYGTPLDRVAMRPDWGAERMKAFATRLSDNLGGLMRSGEESRIVSGEFAIFVMGSTHRARELDRLGAPVRYVIPVDGAVAGFQHLGVPRNSAHPNLAKLFINTIISEEGQRIMWELVDTDHYRLPGSRAESEVAELKTRGSSVFDITPKLVLERPEMAQLPGELERILAQGRGG